MNYPMTNKTNALTRIHVFILVTTIGITFKKRLHPTFKPILVMKKFAVCDNRPTLVPTQFKTDQTKSIYVTQIRLINCSSVRTLPCKSVDRLLKQYRRNSEYCFIDYEPGKLVANHAWR